MKRNYLKSKKRKAKSVANQVGSIRRRRNKRALSSFLPKNGILIPVER